MLWNPRISFLHHFHCSHNLNFFLFFDNDRPILFTSFLQNSTQSLTQNASIPTADICDCESWRVSWFLRYKIWLRKLTNFDGFFVLFLFWTLLFVFVYLKVFKCRWVPRDTFLDNLLFLHCNKNARMSTLLRVSFIYNVKLLERWKNLWKQFRLSAKN